MMKSHSQTTAELPLQHPLISLSLSWLSLLVFSGFVLYFQGCTKCVCDGVLLYFAFSDVCDRETVHVKKPQSNTN